MHSISNDDRLFIDILRGGSILRVVLAHLGLSWIYQPYSGYVLVFLPLLFFVSGAVSFGSYIRKNNPSNYLLNRYLSISIPYYVYILVSFSLYWLYVGKLPSLNFELIAQFFTFNAVGVMDLSPMPVGHIWFLHSLFYIMLISFLVFYFAKDNSNILLLVTFASLVFCGAQSLYGIGSNFMIFNHNFYQPLSNLGFFTLGAYYYINIRYFTEKISLFLFLLFLLLTVFFSFYFVSDYRIAEHFFYPDLFFYLSCLTAIFFTIFMKKYILFFVKKINALREFLLFMNRNSYSVYLLHVYIIQMLSYKYDLMDLSGEPSRAFLKVSLSLIITCIFAVPFSYITRNTTLFLKSKLMATP